ncbi:MAG: hypothetical protein RL448_495 [Actinomycetota bacterium]
MINNPLRLLLQKGSSRILFYVSLFASFIWTAILVIGAWLISDLIIAILNRKDITLLVIQLAVLFTVRSLFLATFENWTARKAVTIKKDLRSEVSANPYALRSLAPAAISNLLTKGLNSIDTYYGRFIPQLIFSFVTPTTLVILFFLNDKLSALIAVLTLPIIPFFGFLIGRFTADAVGKKWQTLSTLSSYFEDSLRGFATLKIFGRQTGQARRIREMGQQYNIETMKVLRISFLSSLALELAATISVALMAVSVGLRLVNGSIDFKISLIILILAPEIYFPIRNAASLFHASTDGTESLKQIELLPERTNHKKTKTNSLSYLGTEILKGERLFLIGDSGSGKTTIALNFVNQYENIAWIPQNPSLASGTVRDQFKLIDSEISDEQIANHLFDAGLTISQLPNGLDSRLESGNELISSASGGQIRKIAIARAVAKKADFIIADEPTADLDSVSAIRIMALLRQQASGLVVITHDYSILQTDDQVIKVGN